MKTKMCFPTDFCARPRWNRLLSQESHINLSLYLTGISLDFSEFYVIWQSSFGSGAGMAGGRSLYIRNSYSLQSDSEQRQNSSEWHFHLTVSHQICDFYKHFFNVVDYFKNRHAARADIYFSSSAARERARRLRANQFSAALLTARVSVGFAYHCLQSNQW